MNNSNTIKLAAVSKRSATGKTGFGNEIKFFLAAALMLVASNAVAGIIFVPLGDKYIDPELAPVSIQDNGLGSMAVHTAGLTGESTVCGSNFQPADDVPTTAGIVMPFAQELELMIDISVGTVSGRANLRYIDASSPNLAATAEVRGTATCLPRNGFACGQLVVDLELRGVLTDPNDPPIVGQLRSKLLGSLIRDGINMQYWAAMSASTTIGGNEELVNVLGIGDWACDGTDEIGV